ncbi:hypothetical protein IMCC3317_34630 [Kordia antarctica]|uniref:Uncharacterized protein n=1 Tax=Kordia antarctica TaxID=1218801 RepID=A0A7L4ZMY2_9FLAO|nr:hypothetical protein [Kordia antarctica]QHI38078.1 hypothetical protein IMCC3317_34630 [Kordia antarctica]
MKTYTFFIVILFLNINSIVAQDAAVFEKVEDIGYKFITPLKIGEIDQFKKRKPPVNTWTYSALAKYKKDLDSKEFILYGSFIMPTTKKEFYNFNYYALKKNSAEYVYFFAISIMISKINGEYKVVSSYLFTEKKALKAWWHHTFNFFESDKFDQIPKEFMKPNICPPPPSF